MSKTQSTNEENQGSIYNFKPGDIIIRTEGIERTRDEPLGLFGMGTTKVKYTDNAYREPHEFVAIENGIIYLRDIKPMFDTKKHVHRAHVEEYLTGWALFKIPEGLTLEDCV